MILSVDGLSKRFEGEESWAVRDVGLEISKQSILTIVGQSGSGKSTLLNLIAGHLSSDTGAIRIHGKMMPDPADLLLPGFDEVNMVKQDVQLSPRRTVLQNVLQSLRHYTEEFRQQRAQELLTMCRLTEHSHKRTMDLSGGQAQRLAIARSLADDPELVIMDEPFNQLDYQTRSELKLEIRDIVKNSGTSALIVTHEPSDALSISDKVGVLDAGQIVQLDTPEQVYYHPTTPYVAQLFGYYSLLDTRWMNKTFKLSETGSHVGIRPEDVILSSDGIPMRITSVIFLGMNYLISLNDRILALWTGPSVPSTAQIVNVCLRTEKLHRFN